MNPITSRRQKGFTIVELMVDLLILTIGVLALASLQVTSIRGNRTHQNHTSAILLGEKKVEVFQNTPFSSLPVVTNQADPNNPMTGTEASGGGFSRFWTIQNYGGSANMKQVSVTVSWTDGLGSHSKTLNTVICK